MLMLVLCDPRELLLLPIMLLLPLLWIGGGGVNAGSEPGGGNRGPGPVNAEWGGGGGVGICGPGLRAGWGG